MRLLLSKLFILAVSMLSSAFLATSASADGSYKDEPVAHSQFSWTGFYVGGSACLVTGNTRGTLGSAGPFIAALMGIDYSMNGATYGVNGGQNYQVGNAVMGNEALRSGGYV